MNKKEHRDKEIGSGEVGVGCNFEWWGEEVRKDLSRTRPFEQRPEPVSYGKTGRRAFQTERVRRPLGSRSMPDASAKGQM